MNTVLLACRSASAPLVIKKTTNERKFKKTFVTKLGYFSEAFIVVVTKILDEAEVGIRSIQDTTSLKLERYLSSTGRPEFILSIQLINHPSKVYPDLIPDLYLPGEVFV